jgi:2-C-methyl-D-erythritol 4-phosphate cytidylyltransferase
VNTAIIVAAGEGRRFGGDRPKQFANILGKPLIIHTLERFEACPAIDEIVLVLSASGLSTFAQNNDVSGISKIRSIVAGGKTRAESVSNGLNAVDAGAVEIVAVHDGARPLVTVDEIARTIGRAADTGAACLVTVVTDTVKTIDGERIVGTVDRRNLRRALTPQAFRFDILMKAFEGVDLSENITDECYLVEKLGIEIATVEGSPRNIKITTADDMIVAESFLMQEITRSHV